MKKIFTYIIALLSLFSCNDYLDIEPKGKVILSSVEDYDLLLANMTHLFIDNELFLTADNFNVVKALLGDITVSNNRNFNLYSFSDSRFFNENEEVSAWNRPYEDIYTINKVINEVDNSSIPNGYKKSDIKIVKAEAKYARAMRYFLLINMFSKHYNKATASNDPSVPIVTKADASQAPPKPSTVEEAYNFIIKDLKEAIPNLPTRRKELNRPSKGSGYALLSRIYLYKGEYNFAIKNAELAIAQKNTLNDFTTVGNNDIRKAYKDEQYTELSLGSLFGYQNGILPDEFLSKFDRANDTRLSKMPLFLPLTEDYSNYIYNPNGIQPNLDCSVAEMYLTLAECHAREGNKQKALENVNKVIKTRISNYVDKEISDFTNNNKILKFILEERRKEMFMGGTRLFDLKRLNLEADFAKTTNHPLGTNFMYKAEPNSGKLVLPIPAQIKKLNPNLR